MIAVYVIYQQFENHVIQVAIMARTVRLSPLTVLVSLLVGVQLFGLIGALLAIPAAGIVQVVAVDVYRERQARRAPEAPADEGESGGPEGASPADTAGSEGDAATPASEEAPASLGTGDGEALEVQGDPGSRHDGSSRFARRGGPDDEVRGPGTADPAQPPAAGRQPEAAGVEGS
jgi:hypothetical protein